MVKKIILCALLIAASGQIANAQMVCAKPSEQYASDIAGDINATASGLTRLLSIGGGAQAHRTIVDLISKYPNADRVLLQRDLISASCELIKNSSASFSEKSEYLLKVIKEIQSAFNKASILLKPFKDSLLVLSSIPAASLNYYIAVVSIATAFRRCSVTSGTVQYGDGIEFTSYFSYNPSELNAILPSSTTFDSGNPVLRIPRRLFFLPVDAARDSLVYFRLLPSGNCYADDVQVHLAIWDKESKRYLAIYKLSSITSHGRCQIFVHVEEANEFADTYRLYTRSLKNENSIDRDYAFAAKGDAFANVNNAKSIEKPHASGNSLTLTFSDDASFDDRHKVRAIVP
jgi:hypothetical protein